jgi:hypothetical protein
MILDENIIIFAILIITLLFIIYCFSLKNITNKLPKIESMRSGGGGRGGGGGGGRGGGGGGGRGGGGRIGGGYSSGRSMRSYRGPVYSGGHNNVRNISNDRLYNTKNNWSNYWNNGNYYNTGNGGNYSYNTFGYVDPVVLLSEPVVIDRIPVIYRDVIIEKKIS